MGNSGISGIPGSSCPVFGTGIFWDGAVPQPWVFHPRNPRWFFGTELGIWGKSRMGTWSCSRGNFPIPRAGIPQVGFSPPGSRNSLQKIPFSWEFLLVLLLFPPQSHQIPHLEIPRGEFQPGPGFLGFIFSQERWNSPPGQSWAGKTSGIFSSLDVFLILELGFPEYWKILGSKNLIFG